MKQRWLVVAVGLPLFLWVLLWCPVWATALLFAAITGIAVYEMIHTAAKNTVTAQDKVQSVMLVIAVRIMPVELIAVFLKIFIAEIVKR